MIFLAHEESKNTSKRCRFIASALKDALSHCHTLHGRSSSSSLEEEEDEYPSGDIDEEQEVIVLEIRSRAMEAKMKRKGRRMTESLCWAVSSSTGELFMAPYPKDMQHVEDDNKVEDNDEMETFFSAESCFSRCSSASREVLFSAGSCFSRCSSMMSKVDFGEARRRSIIQEFCHCEGWPFGLCRKAVLLPPLPRSPSESWSWHKGNRIVIVKTH
ncbi:PREDICTED: uncharacterized protein LOC104605883 [Nelumbo nucifera]|uniref:Uncharacterized protein LOC104605883 n=2 Tax=Nelumbo nucifera TaxID=4432 RepID=A0A1U8AZZ1_NELNU|nr:PREDICTED: uncharacterized protein LOC104605883 [Nelumbo nucifera]DAD41224.1 TPA_asm: hypothetical protein HUJ06_015547 [Nelumbo nucifera]